jgi:nucleoside-diphosphate kinase
MTDSSDERETHKKPAKMMFVCFLFIIFAIAEAFHSVGQVRGSRLFMNNKERTYIMIKPDGVQRGVVGNIIARFEQKGYLLKGLKLMTPKKELLESHYESLKSKPFFPKLMAYMSSGPVVAMAWEGKDAVATGRKMLGATNPADSAPGTIRGDFALDVGRNICHGSDTIENGEREIKLWFPEGLNEYSSHSKDWIYE